MRADRFLRNVQEARECGYFLVCACCGCGMSDDEFEDASLHDTGCPNAGVDRTAQMPDMLTNRLGKLPVLDLEVPSQD